MGEDGTVDWMLTLRQLVEKRLEGQEHMTQFRERWPCHVKEDGCSRGGGEDDGRHIRRDKSTVLCGPGISEEFVVHIGLRPGSALSPLLIIAGVEVISRKTSMRDILRKLLYADHLAVVVDSEIDLQERLGEW